MPYVITVMERTVLTPRLGTLDDHIVKILSRRAVATLEELRDYLWERFRVQNRLVTERGGTIPLPDGTVIEVERASLDHLGDLLGDDYQGSEEDEAAMIVAYNARECRCTCPVEGYDPKCPMARGGIGHVKKCPAGRGACPCLPGSTAEAHCRVEKLVSGGFAGGERAPECIECGCMYTDTHAEVARLDEVRKW